MLLAMGLYAAPSYAEDDNDGDGDSEDGDDGGSDSGDDSGTEEDEEEADKDQPPITAGGLYNIKTYPIRELYRPLTLTQGILQVRAGLGVDVSAKKAFEQYGHLFDFRYGARDNVTLLGGFNSSYNFKQFDVLAGIEASLAYDFIDFRGAVRFGKQVGGNVGLHIDLGFPFRYVAKKEIAIIALDTLMSIDFDGKPDLNPSLGISTNPIEPVSVVIFAQMQIVDFNTDADKILIPATARIQFSPSQRFDLGGEFRFLNLKPAEGKFYDNRFLTLYAQARF
jgi:hypothetical protein